jgi:hypothetical protein
MMNFENPVRVDFVDAKKLWELFERHGTIERIYQETKNVLITLSDKFGTSRLFLFEANVGRGIRVLDENDEYVAVLWKKSDGTIGGKGKDLRGMRKVLQIIKMYENAVFSKTVDLKIEENDMPPSIFIPLTDREKRYLNLLENNLSTTEFSPLVITKMNKSLRRKGIDISEIRESFAKKIV